MLQFIKECDYPIPKYNIWETLIWCVGQPWDLITWSLQGEVTRGCASFHSFCGFKKDLRNIKAFQCFFPLDVWNTRDRACTCSQIPKMRTKTRSLILPSLINNKLETRKKKNLSSVSQQIGRAHAWTPATNIDPVCRLLLEKKKITHTRITNAHPVVHT